MLLAPAPRGSIYRKPHAGSGASTINELGMLGLTLRHLDAERAQRRDSCRRQMFAGGQQRFDGRRRACSGDGTRAWTGRRFAGENSLGETALAEEEKSSAV